MSKIPALTLEVLVRVKGSEELHDVGEIEVPIHVGRPSGTVYRGGPGVRASTVEVPVTAHVPAVDEDTLRARRTVTEERP